MLAGIGWGIISVTPSTVYPGLAYTAPAQWDPSTNANIGIIQKATGQLVRMIDTDDEAFSPQFIYEIPDGRLIVTGGESHKILIIDPT